MFLVRVAFLFFGISIIIITSPNTLKLGLQNPNVWNGERTHRGAAHRFYFPQNPQRVNGWFSYKYLHKLRWMNEWSTPMHTPHTWICEQNECKHGMMSRKCGKHKSGCLTCARISLVGMVTDKTNVPASFLVRSKQIRGFWYCTSVCYVWIRALVRRVVYKTPAHTKSRRAPRIHCTSLFHHFKRILFIL